MGNKVSIGLDTYGYFIYSHGMDRKYSKLTKGNYLVPIYYKTLREAIAECEKNGYEIVYKTSR
jgi:hypothetical protein